MECLSASRTAPGTLVPAARASYEAGRTRSEVLTAVYGVDLPPEAFLIEREFVTGQAPLRVLWNAHPWELMIPLDRGGATFVLDAVDADDEARAFAQAPHVLLLGLMHYPEVPNGISMFGYDLTEVAAGRSTVVGIPHMRQVPGAGAQFTIFGPSLIDVFADVIKAYIASWGTRDGRGANEERRHSEHELAAVEALRRELAGRP